MMDLSVPVFARLGGTECRIGTLTLVEGEDPSVEFDDELLRLAGTVLTASEGA